MSLKPLLELWFQNWLRRCVQSLPLFVKLRFLKQLKPYLPKEATADAIVDSFDPMYPLLSFARHDPFLLKDAFEGVHIFGGNGSGKTSGPGATLLRAYMHANMGGLILTAKPGEYELIQKYARETGRSSSLIRFAPEEKWRFNFLAYEQTRPSRGAGLTSNIVRLFTVVQEAMERGGDGGGKQERYWKNALNQLLSNAVDLCLIAEPEAKLSVARLYDVIISAPVSAAQVDSEEWQSGSLTYQLLEKALRNETLTDRQKSDLRLTGKFFLNEFPGLPHDTRGSIISTFTTMADGLLRGAAGELFSTTTNVVPEMTLEGSIVCLDLPVKLFSHVGLAAQILMKMIFQQCWERRDLRVNRRPVFLWADESHLFVNEGDVTCGTTSRSAGICFSFLSQTLPNYYWALGGEEKGKALTDSLMGVLQTKIFCANSDPKTNEFASSIFGKSWQQKNNFGISNADKGGRSSNSGASDSLEAVVEASQFTSLRKGGPANDFIVDCIIHGGGRRFRTSGQQYLKASFRQKG